MPPTPTSPPPQHTHSSFSYAYKFATNQGTFIACKFDVFTSDDIPLPADWTGDNWTGAWVAS